MMSCDGIFSTFRIRDIELANRIVVPPMVQVRPITSPEGIAWYRRLAAGGAGLVIVEATGVPRFRNELTPKTLRALVDAIHVGGAKVAIQLFPVRIGQKTEPDDLSLEQIEAMIDHYGKAATICRKAGFDGVEPHGAHGYLLNRFFMPDRNCRTDAFGGSLENRVRLAVRIVRRIREAVGENLLILFRHTPTGDAYTMEDSLSFAGQLVRAGIDVLDISPARRAAVADLAAPFKARLSVPVIAVNGMEDPEEAERAVREGRCDLVAVGRQMIADAQWPRKVRDGKREEIRRCTKCDKGCFGNLRKHKPVECVLWPEHELTGYMPQGGDS